MRIRFGGRGISAQGAALDHDRVDLPSGAVRQASFFILFFCLAPSCFDLMPPDVHHVQFLVKQTKYCFFFTDYQGIENFSTEARTVATGIVFQQDAVIIPKMCIISLLIMRRARQT